MNDVRNTNLDKRAKIATKRQERNLLHADCVACGQAIGNWDDSWVHIGGVACEDAPWLNDDTERCIQAGKMMEAYEDHLKVVADGGRNDPAKTARMNRIDDVVKRKRMAKTVGEMESLFKDCHIWHKVGDLHYNRSMMENHLDNALYELELAYQNSGGGTGDYITWGLRTLMVETLQLLQSVEVKPD